MQPGPASFNIGLRLDMIGVPTRVLLLRKVPEKASTSAYIAI